MLVFARPGADFSQGCAGRRIGQGFPVTHPSPRREIRLDRARTVGRKSWGRGQYVHPDYLQNIPDNADKLTNEEDEAP
jgi:hypothetical protein